MKKQKDEDEERNEEYIKSLIKKDLELVRLIKLVRTRYDLRGITDLQIGKALLGAKGNIDDVINLLFDNKNN